MTTRFDENNIVYFLHNFNKEHIRCNPKYNIKIKKRKFTHNEIIKFLTEKSPLIIQQQEPKKFALFYDYNEKYDIKIVVVIKDKYIDLPTTHQVKKRSLKKLLR